MRATISTCSVEGCQCGRPIKKGLCIKHYTRLREHGDPLRERPTLSDRLNSKYEVQKSTGCWIWNAALTSKGYGAIQLGVDKTGYAHRASWESVNGKIPKGLFVCHKCDTPSCINPDHLFLGNHSENMRDMASKKRSMHGEKNTKSKLTERNVLLILESQETTKELAKKFGVSGVAIRNIKKGNTWRDVRATREVFQRMTFAEADQMRLAA